MTAISRAIGLTIVTSAGKEQKRQLEEGTDRLALAGDEVELAQRLRHPDRHRQRDEAEDEARRPSA